MITMSHDMVIDEDALNTTVNDLDALISRLTQRLSSIKRCRNSLSMIRRSAADVNPDDPATGMTMTDVRRLEIHNAFYAPSAGFLKATDAEHDMDA